MPYLRPEGSNARLKRILKELRSAGLSYTHKSSKSYSLAASIAREISNSEQFFSDNISEAFLKTATGRYLDAFGELFGAVRYEPRRCSSLISERNIQFYVQGGGTFGSINNGDSIIIPAGTIIQTQPLTLAEHPIQYEVTADTTLWSGLSRGYVHTRATIEGAAGRTGPRTLIVHDFNSYQDALSGTLKTINNYAIINGADRETDQSLRFRISIAATGVQSGNESAIRAAALAVPGVVDILLVPFWDGIGSVGVFVTGQDNQSSPSLVSEVQLNMNLASGAGIMATAYMPTNVGLSFETRVHTLSPLTINEKNQLRQSLVLATRNTVTRISIGDSFSMNDLGSSLLSLDGRIRDLGEPGGNYFDDIGIWRPSLSTSTGNRIRNTLANQGIPIDIEINEILSPEATLTIPFTFTFTS